MEKPFRLGVIGGGLNSAVGHVHRIAATMDDRWKFVSGCFSTDLTENRRTAEVWGVSPDRCYKDWIDLCEKEQGHVDALLVLTPTPTHAQIVTNALSCGFNVICEKALAANSKEAREILAATQKFGSYLAVTYNYSGYPMIRELKSKVSSGEFGEVIQIHIEMPQEGFIRRTLDGQAITPQDWRLNDGSVPTISLDLGVHLHQLVKFLTNSKPIELVAAEESLGAFSEVIDNVNCIARYSNGLVCQFWQSKAALGERNGLRIRLFGTHGSAEWLQMEPETMRVCDRFGHISIIDRATPESAVSSENRYTRFKAGHPAGFIEAFANYYVDIADALDCFLKNGTQKSPYVSGPKTALEGLFMLEAMSRSAKHKRWESITTD
ncbi:Gfo/Idh/MocA family oxidoreductase [Marinihelvus fidelis]|uniref:Gfo/Idh/MocA family oxidoreductase n=1 Tax=Marinihelvus fidelis TaxID=2613842 RepID=A0A5N0T8W6_9GAMM|nr:Gfo/Idh/MocA family oxidoreductase [Marinihelvus fidelis]KAA9129739.1 Gfo/Idh/MocA family oxidoreductase [Marinihelvus fidelis]